MNMIRTFEEAFDLGFRHGEDGKANNPPTSMMSIALREAYDEGYEDGCAERKLRDIDDKHRANLSEGW